MHDGLSSPHGPDVESRTEPASRRGYLASAAVVAESDGLRRRFASPALSLTAGALVSWLLPMGVVLPTVLGMLAAIVLVVWLSPSATRQAALDRMVELEAFAVPGVPASVHRAAVRRSQRLRSQRYRRRLAASVLRRANASGSAPQAVPIAMGGVHLEPRLARAVAARLLEDADDPRLAVAVGRLLHEGCTPGDHITRLRNLLATC